MTSVSVRKARMSAVFLGRSPATKTAPGGKGPPTDPPTTTATAAGGGGPEEDKFKDALDALKAEVDGQLSTETVADRKAILEQVRDGLSLAVWAVEQGYKSRHIATLLRAAAFKEYAAAKKAFEESDDPPPPPTVIEPSLPSEVFVG